MMKIQCFQHVYFENLGCITNWIEKNGHTINYTKFYENDSLPNSDDFDWLIIMGGPMSVNDEMKFHWLTDEKKAIREAIENNKTVIGICLGAQLIANVLGEEVYKNSEKEIGWFNIKIKKLKESENIFKNAEAKTIKVFHWHGETYKLPANSTHLAYSECCENQAFLYNNKVLGLQFHLEVTKNVIGEMIENGRNELIISKYVQSEREILEHPEFIESNNNLMYQILDNLKDHSYD
jgi:GMP synthase-like glutamine amidotransferase